MKNLLILLANKNQAASFRSTTTDFGLTPINVDVLFEACSFAFHQWKISRIWGTGKNKLKNTT